MTEKKKEVVIQAAALTDAGGRRTNEDAVYTCRGIEDEKIAARGRLYIVADGTGGQEGGQTASHMAITIASEHYYDAANDDPGESLRSAAITAHQALYELAQKVPAWAEMSTTFVGAVVHQGQLYLAHVGDSRAYLIRDGQAKLLTRDHVWLQDDDNYGALTRWLGGTTRPDVEVDLITEPLQESDVLVLCSDGLTDVVDREDIQELAGQHPAPVAARRLVELANRRGTGDNVSVAAIRYGGHVPVPAWRRWAWVGAGVGGVLVVALGAALAFGGRGGGGREVPTVEAPAISTETTERSPAALTSPTPTLPSRIEVEETPTPTPTPPASAVAAGSARQPTSTPIPTGTPTPTPRRPVPQTTSPPTDTPAPTISQRLAAPTLSEPEDKASFVGEKTEVTFRWTKASRPLGPNEYYVLVIEHRAGKDFTWTKETTYQPVKSGKGWLAGMGPELKWQVVIARSRTVNPNEANENPTGLLSDYSPTRTLSWTTEEPPVKEEGGGEQPRGRE